MLAKQQEKMDANTQANSTSRRWNTRSRVSKEEGRDEDKTSEVGHRRANKRQEV